MREVIHDPNVSTRSDLGKSLGKGAIGASIATDGPAIVEQERRQWEKDLKSSGQIQVWAS